MVVSAVLAVWEAGVPAGPLIVLGMNAVFMLGERFLAKMLLK